GPESHPCARILALFVIRVATDEEAIMRGNTMTARALMLAIVAGVVLAPGTAQGQGWIEPRPGIAPADWGIEKLRTTVTVRVSGRVAEVEVEEWFRNNGGGLGEGDYVYPLPGEAVFTS